MNPDEIKYIAEPSMLQVVDARSQPKDILKQRSPIVVVDRFGDLYLLSYSKEGILTIVNLRNGAVDQAYTNVNEYMYEKGFVACKARLEVIR